MNYTVQISAHDASLFINPEEGETDAEFLERAKLAKGKHFVALRIVDIRKGAQKQFQMQSPYFVLENEEERNAVIASTFEAIGKAVISAEKMKANMPPEAAPSALVLPPGFGKS